MTKRTALHRVAAAFVGVLLGAVPVYAQDVLLQAKNYYASASYEEALAALGTLHGKAPVSTEAAMYEVFCLVALGRVDEAKTAMEGVVKADPEYHLTDAQASPRVRAMFETVRQPLLASIVRDAYMAGRDALDRKELDKAVKSFDRVIALAGELDTSKDASLRDLKTLASGFRDLAKAALAPPPPPPPPADATKAADNANAAAPPAAPKVERKIFGPADTDVKPPVAVSQVLPPWRPANALEQKLEFSGVVDLLIDEQGRVASVALSKSVYPRYDPDLVEAARKWTFRPATRNGKPVQYRYSTAVNLNHK